MWIQYTLIGILVLGAILFLSKRFWKKSKNNSCKDKGDCGCS